LQLAQHEHLHARLERPLPLPILFREIPTGCGENSHLYAWLAETMRSMLPQLAKMGIMGVVPPMNGNAFS
jgi:hypothetical protein